MKLQWDKSVTQTFNIMNSHPDIPSLKSCTTAFVLQQPIMVFHWTVIEGNNKWKHFAFLLPILWYSLSFNI